MDAPRNDKELIAMLTSSVAFGTGRGDPRNPPAISAAIYRNDSATPVFLCAGNVFRIDAATGPSVFFLHNLWRISP